ncbi:hypothetical protein ES702_06989 [subsurface metagenome]
MASLNDYLRGLTEKKFRMFLCGGFCYYYLQKLAMVGKYILVKFLLTLTSKNIEFIIVISNIKGKK